MASLCSRLSVFIWQSNLRYLEALLSIAYHSGYFKEPYLLAVLRLLIVSWKVENWSLWIY